MDKLQDNKKNVRVTISITKDDLAYLDANTFGNRSWVIRRLIRDAKAQEQDNTRKEQ